MTCWSDSAASRSPSAVEPVRSTKTTVTVFRTVRAPPPPASTGAPHAEQKRASAPLSLPHLAQTAMPQVYDGALLDSNEPPGVAPTRRTRATCSGDLT